MNILIMGPAGSGKGTMSDYIVQEYNIPHISTGDMFRENIKNQTKLGMEAKSYMDQGLLVPDDVVVGMVGERIKEDDCVNGFLLDGFPRTLPQAEFLENILKNAGKKIDVVVNLNVDFDNLVVRITGRRLCKNCKASYHVKFKPSKVEGVCDNCGSELIQRSDDTVEQLKVRLAEHEKNTKPALELYGAKGVVANIDANVPTDQVWASIKEALGRVS